MIPKQVQMLAAGREFFEQQIVMMLSAHKFQFIGPASES